MEEQPIKYFPRLDLRKLQYLSENFLTHVELNIVLEFIALSDWFNTVETGKQLLSPYMQERFSIGKRVMNRYLQKIRELSIYKPIDGKPNCFRTMPFLSNRLPVLPSHWEFKDVKTNSEWVFGDSYDDWILNGDGAKILTAPSHARLSSRGTKPDKKISQADHDKIISEQTHEHRKELAMLQRAFTEVIEEQRRKNENDRIEMKADMQKEIKKFTADIRKTMDEAISDVLSELRKHDPMAADTLKKRHLELVRD